MQLSSVSNGFRCPLYYTPQCSSIWIKLWAGLFYQCWFVNLSISADIHHWIHSKYSELRGRHLQAFIFLRPVIEYNFFLPIKIIPPIRQQLCPVLQTCGDTQNQIPLASRGLRHLVSLTKCYHLSRGNEAVPFQQRGLSDVWCILMLLILINFHFHSCTHAYRCY